MKDEFAAIAGIGGGDSDGSYTSSGCPANDERGLAITR
jgi:hypothetical protein